MFNYGHSGYSSLLHPERIIENSTFTLHCKALEPYLLMVLVHKVNSYQKYEFLLALISLLVFLDLCKFDRTNQLKYNSRYNYHLH